MGARFEPLGEVARWRVVYDLLVKTDTEDVLTYATIAEALGLDPDEDRAKIAAACRRAIKEHLHEDRRAAVVVVNVGYRVVPAAQQLQIARGFQRKAGRALAAGHSQVTHFDPTGLDPNTRGAFELMARAFQRQADINDRLQRDGELLRGELDRIQVRTERTEDELAEIKARLARLED
jgi:hypothetical protein